MDSILQADIFFFISTIALVLLVVLFAVLLVFVIKILRDARELAAKLKKETSEIIDDVHKVREFLHGEGDKIKKFTDFLGSFALSRFFTSKARAKKAKKSDDSE